MNTLHSHNLFAGQKVRLSGDEPQTLAAAWAGWQRDTVMKRLMNEAPATVYSQKNLLDYFEKTAEQTPPRMFTFFIHTLEDDRLIGQIRLWMDDWTHREAWVGMSIGAARDRGRGYGSDALRLALRYAFDELNMHRVSLGVFEYNHSGIHVYEKLGFRLEGVERAALQREGRRFDHYLMGILQEEWAQRRQEA